MGVSNPVQGHLSGQMSHCIGTWDSNQAESARFLCSELSAPLVGGRAPPLPFHEPLLKLQRYIYFLNTGWCPFVFQPGVIPHILGS